MSKDFLRAASYKFIDILVSKVFRIVPFILLARWLDVQSIGIIGMAEGFLAILGYLEFSFISIIYRDANVEKRSEYFSAAVYFWLAQTLIMVMVSTVCGLYMTHYRGNMLIVYAMAGQALSFSLVAGADIGMAFFGVDLKQRLICGVNLLLGLLSMGTLVVIALWPGVILYTAMLAFNSLLSMIVWIWLLIRKLHMRLLPLPVVFSLARQSFTGFAIWNHLNKSAYDTVLMVDTFILGIFVSLADVGNYTIALKMTSVFLILPTLISNLVTIFLSRQTDALSGNRLINLSVKYALGLSVIQLLLYLAAGRRVIEVVLPASDASSVFLYALLINIGTIFLNASKPFQSLILVRGDLREAFTRVYLPIMIYGMAAYSIFAWQWGAVGSALANISVYGLTGIMVVRYTSSRNLFQWNWHWISEREREVMADYRKYVIGLIRGDGG